MSNANLPSFYLTYYNPLNSRSKSFTSAYSEYLKDVQLARYNAQITSQLIADKFENINEELTKNIRREFSDQNLILEYIDDSLRDGFRKMNQQLSLINLEILNTNILLQNIQELLKLPDDEKKRMRSIELGLKFLKSSKENQELVHDCVKEFESALEYMPQDWFVLYQLGMCYLYNNEILDLDLAKIYFDKSFKYASVEIDDNISLGKHISDAFFVNMQKDNKDQYSLSKTLASESLLQSAFVSYVKEDYDSAANLACKSISFSPYNSRNYLLASKYLIRSKEQNKALLYLKKSMEIDYHSYLLMTNEFEIVNDPFISKEIRKFKDDFIKKQIDHQNKIRINNKLHIMKELYHEFLKKNLLDGFGKEIHDSVTRNSIEQTYASKFYSIPLDDRSIKLKESEINYRNYYDEIGRKYKSIRNLFEYLINEISSNNYQLLLIKIYDINELETTTSSDIKLDSVKTIAAVKDVMKNYDREEFIKHEKIIEEWRLFKDNKYKYKLEKEKICSDYFNEIEMHLKRIIEDKAVSESNKSINNIVIIIFVIFMIIILFKSLG